MFIESHRENLMIMRATESDIDHIVDIINEAFWPSHARFLKDNSLSKQRVSPDQIHKILASSDNELFVLKEKISGLIIGTILLNTNVEGEPNIAKFGLLARWQGDRYKELKIGEMLIRHVINRAKEIGKQILKIEVIKSFDPKISPFLDPLIHYYKKQGFKETGKVMKFPRAHCLQEGADIKLIEMQKEIQIKAKL